MNADFHYFATYCASLIAGYSNEEAEKIAYSANFVDCCTMTMLKKCGAPSSAATTQSQLELADFTTDILGLHEITRIWASFHFLPGDLYAPCKKGWRNYKNKFRLICKPNGELVKDTVMLAKGGSLEAIGIAMHILADTWAHQNFAGTPSLVINNTNTHVYEIFDGNEYQISFSHNPGRKDNIEERKYINSLYSGKETSIMNLGHGRIGHLPDLSFIKYKYLPAWGKWNELIKDNPSDYVKAFTQMVYTLKFYRGINAEFKLNEYDPLEKYIDKVVAIINKRQLSAAEDWKAFASELAGKEVNDFDVKKYIDTYLNSSNKDKTEFNSFILHALKQKSMVTNRIYKSKNKLAGYSIEYNGNSLKGLKDYWKLIKHEIKEKEKKHE